MSEDANFLSRWARRKAEAREEDKREEATATATPEADGTVDEQNRPVTEEEIAALPDPDKLEHGADFKPFLRPGVPQALRQRALRRIWRVNPAIGFLDGMNEYDLDYTDAATVVDNLKTAYQVGRGFVIPEEDDKPSSADVAATPPSNEEADDHAVPAADSDEKSDEELKNTATEAGNAVGEKDEELAALPDDRALPEDKPVTNDRETVEAPLPGRQPGQAAARRWVRFSVPKEG